MSQAATSSEIVYRTFWKLEHCLSRVYLCCYTNVLFISNAMDGSLWKVRKQQQQNFHLPNTSLHRENHESRNNHVNNRVPYGISHRLSENQTHHKSLYNNRANRTWFLLLSAIGTFHSLSKQVLHSSTRPCLVCLWAIPSVKQLTSI